MPFGPFYLLLLFLMAVFFVTFIQLGLLTIAFAKLGLSPETGLLLLFASLFGSGINLPLFTMRAQAPPDDMRAPLWGGMWRINQQVFRGQTVVAVNVGGCLVPVGLSLYLFQHFPLSGLAAVAGVAMVAAISYIASRPIPGVGIGMPVFVAPLAAVLAALLLDPEQGAPLGYISGTLGVLVGADLLHLPAIRRLGAPVASIGGAGTFDGIFLTGIVAALLA